MPRRNRDLHGNVPDESDTALLLLDFINDFEFAGSDKLFKNASAVVPKLTALKVQARAAGIPPVRQRQLRPMDFGFPPLTGTLPQRRRQGRTDCARTGSARR
jgi:nicotinamidase-related amidase